MLGFMHIDPAASGVSTVLAAVMSMMTQYERNRCPRLALAIAAHLDGLSRNPQADFMLRRAADELHDHWHLHACTVPEDSRNGAG